MITRKSDVRMDVIGFGGVRILSVLSQLSKKYQMDIMITSGTDGVHSGPLDPHKLGNAYDIKTHDMPSRQFKDAIVRELNNLLSDKFYAFLEDPDLPNEHIHIQVAKGKQFTIEDLFNTL